jgi:hypothetical protein
LPHNFQNAAFEFRKFIKEQNTVMAEGYFPGLGKCTSSDQGNIGYYV